MKMRYRKCFICSGFYERIYSPWRSADGSVGRQLRGAACPTVAGCGPAPYAGWDARDGSPSRDLQTNKTLKMDTNYGFVFQKYQIVPKI